MLQDDTDGVRVDLHYLFKVALACLGLFLLFVLEFMFSREEPFNCEM